MTDKEILSQDEVDALLDNVDDAVPVDGGDHRGEVTVLDFHNQERVVRSQFPVLERIHERLSRRFVINVYDLMSREIEITVDDMKVYKFSEYMATLKIPTSINIVRIHPLRGKALVTLDSELVFALVDHYFGGSGVKEHALEGREYTLTESRITEIILDIFFSDMTEAWTPIMQLKPELIGNEMNPQLVNAASSNDVMLVTSFAIKFSEESGGNIHIVIPYTMLEPIREQLELGSARSDDEIDPNWVSSLKEEILDVPLNISSVLTKATLGLREITDIHTGDVINIEMPDFITLDVEGIPMFQAKYGVSRDKCALKIIKRIQK